MRHFKKIDWSISLSLFFACVLTFIAACVNSSGPLGAPNVVEVGTVSSVKLTLAQPILTLGQTTQATVVATSADGNVVSGAVDFSSQNPSIATVSSKGAVTALAAGVAVIQAAVASHVATASVTVQSVASPVAVVQVALDSTSLAIGHAAKATAVAKDAAGNVITGQAATWASLSPTIATVSSTGAVMAVAPGSATIKGTISGTSGSASLTVVQVSDSGYLASHDFNDGTPGPYTNGTPTDIDFPDDPTGSGHGKVARFHYAGTNQDRNRSLGYSTVSGIKLGQTIYFRGDLYFPTGTDLSAANAIQRKLVYWQRHLDYTKYGANGGPVFFSLIHMFGAELRWDGGYVPQSGSLVEVQSPVIARLVTGQWYTLEQQMTVNSTPSAKDGIVRIWLDGVLIFEKLDMSWTDPAWDGQVIGTTVLDWNDVYFQYFDVGDQVNWSGTYDEYRYWDNMTFSSSRIGQ